MQYGKLVKHLGFKIRTFGRIRRFLSTKAATMVYKSTILPILDYNDYFQFLWNADKVHKLQKLQNWALRIVFYNKMPRLSEDELHTEAGLEVLTIRRISHLLCLMYYRSKNEELLDNRALPTRQFDKVKFKTITPDVKKAFKSPNYLGAKLWDLLPIDTQKAASIYSFKNKIAQHARAGLFRNIR